MNSELTDIARAIPFDHDAQLLRWTIINSSPHAKCLKTGSDPTHPPRVDLSNYHPLTSMGSNFRSLASRVIIIQSSTFQFWASSRQTKAASQIIASVTYRASLRFSFNELCFSDSISAINFYRITKMRKSVYLNFCTIQCNKTLLALRNSALFGATVVAIGWTDI